MGKAYFCIDIGGTKTALAIYGENAQENYYISFPTEPQKGIENLIDRIYFAVKDKLNDYIIMGGAIASPGPLDVKKGKIIYIATMGWRDVPIVALFQRKFNIPFKLINDCNAGALGEYNFGKEKGTKNMCYISISTGIGGGIIADGKLYEGNGNSAEFGHITVCGENRICGCGKTDCLELYSSGTAVEKGYFELTAKMLSAKEIASLARQGEKAALLVFKICGEKLDFAIKNILSIVDPEKIVLGGGMVSAVDLFLPYIECEKISISNLNGKQVLLGVYNLTRGKI